MFIFPRRSKYGQGNLEGNRFKTHTNGTLEIKSIEVADQGTYLCVVSNVAGRDENQVRIEVKGEEHLFRSCAQFFALLNNFSIFFSQNPL